MSSLRGIQFRIIEIFFVFLKKCSPQKPYGPRKKAVTCVEAFLGNIDSILFKS